MTIYIAHTRAGWPARTRLRVGGGLPGWNMSEAGVGGPVYVCINVNTHK